MKAIDESPLLSKQSQAVNHSERRDLRILQLQQRYKAQLPNTLKRLTILWRQIHNERISKRALDLIVQRLHGLVSSAATYGFRELAQLAKPIENIALEAFNKSKVSHRFRHCMPRFLKQFELFIAKLDIPKLPKRPAIAVNPENIEGSVLIVKEDADMVEWLTAHLEFAGLQTTTLSKGIGVLQRAERFKPDVILLSLFLLDKNGLEVCRAIRSKAEFSSVPIIVLTSIRRKDLVLRAYEAGADDFLSIPIDSQILTAKVKAMIRRRRQTLANSNFQLKPGLLFDNRFHILELLGRGGFGEVYKVHDKEQNTIKALKIVSASSRQVRVKDRFEVEIAAMRRIDHPGVIRLHDRGVFRGRPYFTMDYYAKGALSKRLEEKGAMKPHEALRVLSKVARALHYSHEMGILHRDLKPDNILHNEIGEPVLTDFGLATQLDANATRLTSASYVVGTPWYMAPEQITCDRPLDRRCDIYSLGILFFQMLTGRPPYWDERSVNVIGLIAQGQLPSLASSLPNASQAIIEFFERLTKHDPEDRPANAFIVANMAVELAKTCDLSRATYESAA